MMQGRRARRAGGRCLLVVACLVVVPGCGGSEDREGDGQGAGDGGAAGAGTSDGAGPATSPADESAAVAAGLSPEERDAANRAVGLMGRYDYAAAVAVLEPLVAASPGWLDGRVNLAIAVLNRQQEGDEQRALDLLLGVLEAEPEHPRALYVAGLLELRSGEIERAADRFARVVELDRGDAYAAYFHGQAIEPAAPERALAEYERALAIEPSLRSAVYRAASVLRRLGRIDASRSQLELFQRLDGNPQARSAEFVYTKMGEKAELVPPPGSGRTNVADDVRPARPVGPVFADGEPLQFAAPDGDGAPPRILEGVGRTPAIAAADLDRDGAWDLVVAGAGGDMGSLVLRQHEGAWHLQPLALPPAESAVNAILLGDLDDDGDVDQYLLRRGPNALLLADSGAPGGWRDATEESGTAGDGSNSIDGAMVDVDHDGDLDLFVVNADGADDVFSHDLDGRFRSLRAEAGLDGAGAGSRRVLLDDLDADRDLDFVVLGDDGPVSRRNDRLWAWEPAAGLAPEDDATWIRAAVTADADADGRVEVYALGEDHRVRRWTAGTGWSAPPVAARDASAGGDAALPMFAVLDVDGDGRPDLLSLDATGAPRLDPLPGGPDGPPSVALAGTPGTFAILPDADPTRGPALVVARPDEPLQLHRPGPGRWPFLALQVRGRTDAANSLRSNAAGIGTRFAARAGDRWTAGRFLREHSGPGQGELIRFIGLGDRPRLDFVELEWPDGVFQSEVHGAADAGAEPVDLSPGSLLVEETQRQLSSCPVIFAWDGTSWTFVSDVLGIGGLGYLVEPGVFAPPRPRERFLMPAGLPAARDGRLAIKLHEPMEEVCYLDHAAFDAWDLPPGWDLVPDERLDLGAPAATGAPRFFRVADERRPVRASNDRGEDVTAHVLELDDVAAPTPEPDRRFIGRLTAEHVLQIEFDGPLDVPGSGGASTSAVPTLVIDGWVEYPYSQTNFAAWQAGLEWAAPTIEAQTVGGDWVVIADRFGYPAGMPRRMSLPLQGLPVGCTTLRLRTNVECYVDRISVVPTVAASAVSPAPRHRRLEPVKATLRRSGFPARTTGPQRRPWYDYDQRRPFADMRAQRGFHTAEGDVLALVAEIDDATATFGPGEEVTVEMEAPPPPPRGWTQRLVLDVAGWCKDMDLFTGDGETVEPMPSRSGTRSEAAVELDQRTRTRFRSGR